jgi:flagellar biosynthesis protein FliR
MGFGIVSVMDPQFEAQISIISQFQFFLAIFLFLGVEGDCPNVETFRTSLCLFKTGMPTLDLVDRQVDALRSTIKYYA